MKLVLYGASGHGKVVADIVRCQNRSHLVGFIDDDPSKTGSRGGGAIPVLGTREIIPTLLSAGVRWVMVSIGGKPDSYGEGPRIAVLRFSACDCHPSHPSAVIASDVYIGEGTVVMPGVVINPGVVVGRNVIINTGATIDHDLCHGSRGSYLTRG